MAARLPPWTAVERVGEGQRQEQQKRTPSPRSGRDGVLFYCLIRPGNWFSGAVGREDSSLAQGHRDRICPSHSPDCSRQLPCRALFPSGHSLPFCLLSCQPFETRSFVFYLSNWLRSIPYMQPAEKYYRKNKKLPGRMAGACRRKAEGLAAASCFRNCWPRQLDTGRTGFLRV